MAKRQTSLPQHINDAVRAGDELVGEDFTVEQLTRWFAQEQEAFYEDDAGGGGSATDPWYDYMRFVNERLAFRRLRGRPAGALLVIGPGSGIEMVRFTREQPGWRLSFLEASEGFQRELTATFPGATVIPPTVDGRIDAPDHSQDVVCAFSVLHHIPNVSAVLRETHRVLKPGGVAFIREPCSSMGDWREPRSATPNERGISRRYLVAAAERSGLTLSEAPIPILLEPINKLLRRTIGYSLIPKLALYGIDRALSRMLAINDRYWRDSLLKKFGPSSYFYVFSKPRQPDPRA